MDLAISYVELQVTANAWGITSNANEHKDGASSWQPGLHGKPIRDCMQYFARRYRDGKLRVDSVTVRAQKAALAGKELKRLVRAAWCEAFGVEIPTEEGLQIQTKEKKEKQTALREELLAELRGGAKGVRKWNARKLEERKLAGSFRRVDLTGFELAGVDLQDLDFQDSNFDKADLSGAKIVRCKLGSASFKGANLENIQASAVKATGANFGGASLRGASLQGSTFKNSVFENANLDKADLMYCDLCGADLRSATHKDASFAHIKFDELTRLPKGFDFANTERWVGKGVDPRIAKAVAKKPRGPIDLPKFLKRLEANTEAAKLEKAVSMLKADRFKLYAQVADDFLVGVVKSQTDQDLVYSCRLGADGVYGCCTQNLNICGGLRGSLCKHLLVLIIGLANGNELDLGGVDGWIAASRLQKPVLDKEAMSETFLRYKGAEAGEVDWRPTETIPEDYYAL
ncbi:MAG: pentapeptide repeat-containing protein [Planctomycetes bacterium]|nr:pentapeptide repeat-containing protein [Planctomycetota bacterium]